MMLNWAELSKNCAKTLLLVLNGCCVLVALCTFVFAVVDMKILKQYGEEQTTGTYISDIIIILASLVLVTVFLFGCIGTIKENVKILYLFVGFIMIMVVLEVFIAIFVSIQRYGLEFRVLEWLREDFFHNVTGDHELHEKLWNDLQTTYECCGLNGPDDYLAIEKELSLSCCPRAFCARTSRAQERLYQTCISSAEYYMEGCEDEILSVLRSDADWLIGVAVTCFWFETCGILLAMWVAKTAKNNTQVYKQTLRY